LESSVPGAGRKEQREREKPRKKESLSLIAKTVKKFGI
jgi:hypothetical protein